MLAAAWVYILTNHPRIQPYLQGQRSTSRHEFGAPDETKTKIIYRQV